MKKTPLIISIAVTTLILITLASVITVVQGKSIGIRASDTDIDAAVLKAITERDKAYQHLIDEANQRLEEAEQEQQDLQEQVDDLQGNDSSTSGVDTSSEPASLPSSPPSQFVSPEQAAELAANRIGETQIYSVESGSSNGVPVFKVTFSSGTIVMVSVEGEILVVQLPSVGSGASGFGTSNSSGNDDDDDNAEYEEEHEDEDEHEEEDEHEDEEEHEEEHEEDRDDDHEDDD